MPPIVIAAGIAAGASVAGGYMQSRAANKATNAQVGAANSAAAAEAQSAREALDFAKAQEEQRKREFAETQQRNYDIYLTQRKDLAPYRRLGAGAIGQMAQPIPRVGSLGQMVRG